MAGACSLNIECQQASIDFRLRTRYVDEQATDLDEALARIDRYTKKGKAFQLHFMAMLQRFYLSLFAVVFILIW